ncbi:MAG TPA: hypothetical protein VIF62_16055 [Labilithrix sp.]
MKKLGVALLASTGAALVAFACADDPHLRTSPDQALGGSGGTCDVKPGNLPPPDCDDSTHDCPNQPGCTFDDTMCGSSSTCLPMADNANKSVLDFRIRRLNIATPAALASKFIQTTIVTLNVDLDAKQCGELGKGLFTWLLRVDKTNNQIITGGAPPSSDPFGMGWCFAQFTNAGAVVAPITVPIQFDGDKFKTLEKKNVRIPIFLTEDPASTVLLPISEVQLENVTITDNGNCIGSLNKAAIDSNCFDNKEDCLKWIGGGALGGYITLEDADTVHIRELNQKTLCAFLSGESELSCGRDGSGKILYQGDYCSKDHTAGSCADSVWLSATFAAAATKIFDGMGTVAACSGQVTGDAGTDAAPDAPSDASGD